MEKQLKKIIIGGLVGFLLHAGLVIPNMTTCVYTGFSLGQGLPKYEIESNFKSLEEDPICWYISKAGTLGKTISYKLHQK